MTPTSIVDHSIFQEITKSCEKLINETQTDLELFKHEQTNLRERLLEVIEENERLNAKLENLKIAAAATISGTTTTTSAALYQDARDDATREQLTNDALKNSRKQIDFLQMENNELRSLNQSSQRTIQNLEEEIQNYRNQLFKPNSIEEVKQKYDTAIKLLESSIRTQKTEIAKQTQIIENLFEQKRQLHDHIKNLEAALEEKERDLAQKSQSDVIIEKLKAQLNEVIRQNHDLENSLNISKRVIEERFDREKCALQKVQEALAIAEVAVADKEEAQKREQVVKEECDNLASTIGQVMDEAACKVEKDMEALRKNFCEKEKVLIGIQERLKEELQNQKKFNQILETRCNRFEHKFTEVVKENERLAEELQAATRALDTLEIKLETNKRMLQKEKEAQSRAAAQEQQLQDFMQSNKQIKQRYKVYIQDLTNEYDKKINRMQEENDNLKIELQKIRLQDQFG